MSKETKRALRNARYNVAITHMDVVEAEQKAKLAIEHRDLALRVHHAACNIMMYRLAEHGPSKKDRGLIHADERAADFATEQAGKATGDDE